MLVEVPYNQNKTEVKIEDARVAGVIAGNDVPITDEDETVRKAIENPLNSKSYEDFLKKVERETGSICAPIHLSGGGKPPEIIHGGKSYSVEEWRRVKDEGKKDEKK